MAEDMHTVLCPKCFTTIQANLAPCCAKAVVDFLDYKVMEGEMPAHKTERVCGAYHAAFNHFRNDYEVLLELLSDELGVTKQPSFESILVLMQSFVDSWQDRVPIACGQCFVCKLIAATPKPEPNKAAKKKAAKPVDAELVEESERSAT